MSSSLGGPTSAPASGAPNKTSSDPLSERELEMVQRLFSDPFAIPLEFKAWLVAYLEANPPLLTAASVFGFRSSVASIVSSFAPTGFLPGMCVPYLGDPAGGDPDPKWLIADGRTVDRTTYAALYAVVGFQFSPTPGTDPGSNLFYLPDGRARAFAAQGTHADMTRGKTDGFVNAIRRFLHKHSVGDSGHVHATPNVDAFNHNPSTGSTGSAGGDRSLVNVTATSSATTGVTVGPQTGSEPTDTVPYFVGGAWIVYTG